MTKGAERGGSNIGAPWAAAIAVALASIAIWGWLAVGGSSSGDGAQYLAHALALMEGRPYDDTGYLYTATMWGVGPPQYPPGLPVTLVPLLAAFGTFSVAPFVLMHVFLFAFAILSGVYFARENGSAVGWAVTAMVATGLLLNDRANVVGTDMGFCAMIWAVMVLADRGGDWSTKRSGALTLIGVGALTYRVAAAPLIPALGAFALLNRKRVGWAAVLIGAVWLVVFLVIFRDFGPWEAEAPGLVGGTADVAGPSGGLLQSLERWISTATRRLGVYQNAASGAYLYPFPWRPANQVYQLGAFGLTLVGLWGWTRRNWATFAALFAGTTLAMLFLAPVWQARYLWVLTPFLCFGMLQGAVLVVRWTERAVSKLQAPSRPRLSVKLSMTIVALAVISTMIQPRTPRPIEPEVWRDVRSALEGLETAEPLRIASNQPRGVAWFTGVPAMSVVWWQLPVFLSEAESRRITHVVLTPALGGRQAEVWEGWRRSHPDLFVDRAEIGPVRIFEVTRYTP